MPCWLCGLAGMGCEAGWLAGLAGFPERLFLIRFLDAVLQNEIWPFGSQRKKRKLNVENKIQFGWGFTDEQKT